MHDEAVKNMLQGLCEQTVKVLQLIEVEGIEPSLGSSPDVVTYSTLIKAFMRAKKFDQESLLYVPGSRKLNNPQVSDTRKNVMNPLSTSSITTSNSVFASGASGASAPAPGATTAGAKAAVETPSLSWSYSTGFWGCDRVNVEIWSPSFPMFSGDSTTAIGQRKVARREVFGVRSGNSRVCLGNSKLNSDSSSSSYSVDSVSTTLDSSLSPSDFSTSKDETCFASPPSSVLFSAGTSFPRSSSSASLRSHMRVARGRDLRDN
ncbi:hypothetical protein U1Q18_017825 [Sarracenia purpurea var. burkii]